MDVLDDVVMWWVGWVQWVQWMMLTWYWMWMLNSVDDDVLIDVLDDVALLLLDGLGVVGRVLFGFCGPF